MFDTLLVKPIFNVLAGVYAFLPLHDFGLAIIVLTIIIRLVLWPLVNRQLHSQRAIQKLQPEVNRIRKEAAGDKQKESKMIMELYKEKEINPMAPLIPILIQLPIFIALFVVLKDVIDPHKIASLTYEPLRHLGPLADIISGKIKFNPTLFGLVQLGKPSVWLALTAGAAQYIQTRQLQPKQQPTDAQAKAMSTMTYIFPGLTVFIGLTLPAALALYWTFTSLVAIIQQYIVLKQDVEDIESAPRTKEVKNG